MHDETTQMQCQFVWLMKRNIISRRRRRWPIAAILHQTVYFVISRWWFKCYGVMFLLQKRINALTAIYIYLSIKYLKSRHKFLINIRNILISIRKFRQLCRLLRYYVDMTSNDVRGPTNSKSSFRNIVFIEKQEETPWKYWKQLISNFENMSN